jgi:hypothetical protein
MATDITTVISKGQHEQIERINRAVLAPSSKQAAGY